MGLLNSGAIAGAIGGLGQGLSSIGDDIMKRREQALEWAQHEAMFQEELAAKRVDAQTAFQNETTMQTQRDTAAMARTQAEQAGETQRSQDTQAAENARQDKTIAAGKDLARLRGQIDMQVEKMRGQVDIQTARLRDQLNQDDVKGITYGAPDKNGYAEVFIVTNSGNVKSTGKKVFRPQTTSQVVGSEDDQL